MNKSRTTYFNTLLVILLVEILFGLVINTQDIMGVLLTTLGLGMGIYALKFTFAQTKRLTIILAVVALVWGVYILTTSETVADWFKSFGFQVMVPLLAAAGLGAGQGPKKDVPEEGSRLFPAGPTHSHNRKNVLKNTKGFMWGRKNKFRAAKEA